MKSSWLQVYQLFSSYLLVFFGTCGWSTCVHGEGTDLPRFRPNVQEKWPTRSTPRSQLSVCHGQRSVYFVALFHTNSSFFFVFVRRTHNLVLGDNPLTACHVATELKIASKPILMLEALDEDPITEKTVVWKVLSTSLGDNVSSPKTTSYSSESQPRRLSFCCTWSHQALSPTKRWTVFWLKVTKRCIPYLRVSLSTF